MSSKDMVHTIHTVHQQRPVPREVTSKWKTEGDKESNQCDKIAKDSVNQPQDNDQNTHCKEILSGNKDKETWKCMSKLAMHQLQRLIKKARCYSCQEFPGHSKAGCGRSLCGDLWLENQIESEQSGPS